MLAIILDQAMTRGKTVVLELVQSIVGARLFRLVCQNQNLKFHVFTPALAASRLMILYFAQAQTAPYKRDRVDMISHL